eukprot:g2388.t1
MLSFLLLFTITCVNAMRASHFFTQRQSPRSSFWDRVDLYEPYNVKGYCNPMELKKVKFSLGDVIVARVQHTFKSSIFGSTISHGAMKLVDAHHVLIEIYSRENRCMVTMGLMYPENKKRADLLNDQFPHEVMSHNLGTSGFDVMDHTIYDEYKVDYENQNSPFLQTPDFMQILSNKEGNFEKNSIGNLSEETRQRYDLPPTNSNGESDVRKRVEALEADGLLRSVNMLSADHLIFLNKFFIPNMKYIQEIKAFVQKLNGNFDTFESFKQKIGLGIKTHRHNCQTFARIFVEYPERINNELRLTSPIQDEFLGERVVNAIADKASRVRGSFRASDYYDSDDESIGECFLHGIESAASRVHGSFRRRSNSDSDRNPHMYL